LLAYYRVVDVTFTHDQVDRRSNAPFDAQSRDRAIEALRSGEVIVYPTETFYGMGADALSPAALDRLFALKGREPGKPVALIAADARSAFELAREVSEVARRLADAFWPGPLTLVMPARDDLPAPLLGPDGGVGVRVSSHPIACALAAGLGRPITATSANLAGGQPATTLAQARNTFGAKVKVYLEGGKLTAAAPSTVVAWDRNGWRILREGAISDRTIAAALSGKDLR
jgi:L-threonylcarbamoyladenylate synthase